MPAARTAGAQRKKVPVMIDVACFCGCCFSFDAGAAACPRCGEIATVTAGLALGDAGRSQPALFMTAASSRAAGPVGRPAGLSA